MLGDRGGRLGAAADMQIGSVDAFQQSPQRCTEGFVTLRTAQAADLAKLLVGHTAAGTQALACLGTSHRAGDDIHFLRLRRLGGCQVFRRHIRQLRGCRFLTLLFGALLAKVQRLLCVAYNRRELDRCLALVADVTDHGSVEIQTTSIYVPRSIETGGKVSVMRHDQESLVFGARQVAKQAVQAVTGLIVQIAGRLVGQDELGFHDESPGDRDPLTLATGELARPVLKTVIEAYEGQQISCPGFHPISVSGDQRRHHDILQCGKLRQKIVKLKNKAHVPIAELRPIVIVECQDVDVTDLQLTLCWSIQGAQDVEQRALAHPGCTGNGDGLTLPQFNIDPTQHLKVLVAAAVDLAHILRA